MTYEMTWSSSSSSDDEELPELDMIKRWVRSDSESTLENLTSG